MGIFYKKSGVKLFNSFKKNRKKYVFLPKDEKWIFCFKQRNIITHQECDYYEHNKECNEKGDYWGRTHSDKTMGGSKYVGDDCSILNECDYCIKQRGTHKKYRLSERALRVMEMIEF